MRTHLFRLAALFSILVTLLAGWHTARSQATTPVDQAVTAAFEQAEAQDRATGATLAAVVYDITVQSIDYAKDGSTALLWLALTDPQTGEVEATEPGLSIARKSQSADPTQPGSWAITMQTAPDFATRLLALPPELLSDELRQLWQPVAGGDAQAAGYVFTGYKLPWEAGQLKKVTNSIGHVMPVAGGLISCKETCRFAYDFADGTMFRILASKGGTVKAFRITCQNNDKNCANYLVLEDMSTTPTTYQLYYHLANESIPADLRVLGTPVQQGQYLANADNTGPSTGHHLHFHIYLSPTGTNWSWGYSQDFLFGEVGDNGGHPRTCAEAKQYPELGPQCQPLDRYLSNNVPAGAPTASLWQPATRQPLTSNLLPVRGTAAGEVTRVQAVANFNSQWNNLGDLTIKPDGTFTGEVNLCTAGVPDGPFGFSVRVYGKNGSLAGNLPVVSLAKTLPCTPPVTPPPSACTPSADQVALYAEPDFKGACTKFSVNAAPYTGDALGAVGDNQAASIQVGSSVRAVVYDQPDLAGRVESFENNDAGLSDNLTGVDRVSGLLVQPRSAAPGSPVIQPVGSKWTPTANPTSTESLVLAWTGAPGAVSYAVTLTGPNVNLQKTVTDTALSVGSLAPGAYTLTVTAKNSAGDAPASATFTVDGAVFPGGSPLAVGDAAQLAGTEGWIVSGLWQRTSYTVGKNPAVSAWVFYDGADYTADWKAGDLTSPPVALPAGAAQYLNFRYYPDVEDSATHWDRRLVQISADGGPFTDLVQLSDDMRAYKDWRPSGPISLAAYAGKVIRVRFHFDTVDTSYNAGQGWAVDSVAISPTGPDLSCADQDQNGPAQAAPITLGAVVQGVICPAGDADWYQFHAQAGDRFSFNLDARTLSPASKLDSYIFLIDSDGRSVLAENDDEAYLTKVDSVVGHEFTRAGDYYLKVIAWNHPGVGGPTYNYTIHTGSVPAILSPAANTGVPTTTFTLSAETFDTAAGPTRQVDFFWHGPDWVYGNWVKVGTDTSATGGWTASVNPQTYGGVFNSAMYVLVTRTDGSVQGLALYDLSPGQYMRTFVPLLIR